PLSAATAAARSPPGPLSHAELHRRRLLRRLELVDHALLDVRTDSRPALRSDRLLADVRIGPSHRHQRALRRRLGSLDRLYDRQSHLPAPLPPRRRRLLRPHRLLARRHARRTPPRCASPRAAVYNGATCPSNRALWLTRIARCFEPA